MSARIIRSVFLAFLVLASYLDGQATAENWTRFRGPNGNGHAGALNFPATWTEADYLWKINLPGIGHSSPVGWGDRLFVTSGEPNSGAVTLSCLSAETGAELWQTQFEGQTYSMHAGNSYASTTPTVDAEQVYLTWSSGGKMHCAALTHEGQEVWQKELGVFVGPHGFASSPVIVDEVVCVQIDEGEQGYLAGIDAASGELRWRVERPGGKASYSSPCVVTDMDGRTLLISQSMTAGLQAVEVKTGEVFWQLADVMPARTVSSPVLAGELLVGVCGGGGSGKQLVALDLSGSRKPVVKLTLTKNLPYVPTPLAVGSLLFLWHDQGRIACTDLDSDDPSKMLWNKRIGGKYFGSPIVVGDKIYCMSMEGRAVVIAADREYAVLGDNDLGEPSNATPAVHDNKLYLRTESTLACLAAE